MKKMLIILICLSSFSSFADNGRKDDMFSKSSIVLSSTKDLPFKDQPNSTVCVIRGGFFFPKENGMSKGVTTIACNAVEKAPAMNVQVDFSFTSDKDQRVANMLSVILSTALSNEFKPVGECTQYHCVLIKQ